MFRERDNYVIVGGGAAGLVVCLRLLEAGCNVTLVERGSEFADAKADVTDPIDWGFAANGTGQEHCEATRNLTAPQAVLGDRQIPYPQGSGLGGSTNINACIWTAGHPHVFDLHWPPSWNSQQMNQYLSSAMKLLCPSVAEATEGMPESILTRQRVAGMGFAASGSYEPDAMAAEAGFWSTAKQTSKYLITASSSSLAASAAGGSTPTPPTSHRQTRLQDLIRNHGATATGGKLLLYCDAEAEFLVFEGTIATGVFVRLKTGANMLLKPVGCGEIILCCGTLETPRLLIASGLKGESYRSAACARYQTQINAEIRAREKAREKEGLGPEKVGRMQGSGASKNSVSRAAKTSGAPFAEGSERGMGSGQPDSGHQGSMNLVGIGMNLQDHIVLPVICIGNWWSKPCRDGTPRPRGLWPWLRGLVSILVSPLSSSSTPAPSLPPNSVHGWIDLDANGNVFEDGSSPSPTSPSAQVVFIDGRMAAGLMAEMLLPRFTKPTMYAAYLRPLLFPVLRFIMRLSFFKWLSSLTFGFLVCLTKPYSRGGLANPTTTLDPDSGAIRPQSGPLQVDPAYLTDERDIATLRAAMATAHSMLEESRQRDKLWYLELLPGLPFNYCLAEDYFLLYARLFAAPYYHACGTCQMGGCDAPVATTARPVNNSVGSDSVLNDATAPAPVPLPQAGKRTKKDATVVDAELRVLGVVGLRIADASVFPSIPSGPISAVCMAVGEGCASFLLRDQHQYRECLPTGDAVAT